MLEKDDCQAQKKKSNIAVKFHGKLFIYKKSAKSHDHIVKLSVSFLFSSFFYGIIIILIFISFCIASRQKEFRLPLVISFTYFLNQKSINKLFCEWAKKTGSEGRGRGIYQCRTIFISITKLLLSVTLLFLIYVVLKLLM